MDSWIIFLHEICNCFDFPAIIQLQILFCQQSVYLAQYPAMQFTIGGDRKNIWGIPAHAQFIYEFPHGPGNTPEIGWEDQSILSAVQMVPLYFTMGSISAPSFCDMIAAVFRLFPVAEK